jgi:23S rRNA U2552 (ribose-2'-O)-methylase RlmE/FtsJ
MNSFNNRRYINNKKIIAHKDKLFRKMKYLGDTYWHLEPFERESNTKFIENNEELYKIGHEILENIKNIKINNFVDICSAPGIYSELILNNFDNTYGIGISLPVQDGGIPFAPFNINNKKFKAIYENIMKPDYKLELNKIYKNKKISKIDFGMASCVSYEYDAKNAYFLNLDLIIKSLILILSNLKKNGNLIINLTIKNIDLAFNIINLLNHLFNKFKLWKSETVWTTKKTFYYFGYGFKNNFNVKFFNDLYQKIRNDKDPVNNEFLGSEIEYNKIYKQMKYIYLIRIKAWHKLIN